MGRKPLVTSGWKADATNLNVPSMNQSDAFAIRMTELDELVEECRGNAPFTEGTVRDTSNRSGRDWPWWSVEIEQTHEDGADRRRVSATIRLNSTQAGGPGSFEGKWLARVWQGVSVDNFRAEGGWPLQWEQPTPKDLQDTMTTLLCTAQAAISEEQQRNP